MAYNDVRPIINILKEPRFSEGATLLQLKATLSANGDSLEENIETLIKNHPNFFLQIPKQV
jgi:hypothetical protein